MAKWVDFCQKIAEQEGYEVIDFQPQLGGEDFAHYLHHLPGAFINLGSQSPYALHHPKFLVNRDMIMPAANYLAKLAEQGLIELAQHR